MNRRLLPALAIVLAFVLFAVIDGGGENREPASNELARHLQADYDYYINDMLLDRFGADDLHSYSLQAQRVTHYPAGDLSQLEAPTLDWHGEGQSPWKLGARRGTMHPAPTAGEYVLTLNDDVHASTALQDGRILNMHTASLELVPASKTAHTADPVRIENGSLQMRGTGMHIDMNERRIRLLAEVSARHEPPTVP